MAQRPFHAIEAAIAALPEERQRGDAFEHAVAHYLRHDPERGMRQVWTWADWPGRLAHGLPGTDLGIDLVAEDEVGRLVGVQVKHRLDPRQAIRWGDVATAVGYRPDLFERRLVVTNAYDRTANTQRATATTPALGWVLRDDLLASPIDWDGALQAGSGTAAPVTVRFQPRPYQRAAVRDVVAALVPNERAQLVMACGTGKTLVTLWVAEARQDQRVLVLVPTLLLLKQFRREWRTHAQLPFVDLAVCSDADTVGRDEWRVRADELGVPVTTDPTAIAAFLRGPGRRVVFATYASSARIAEAQAGDGVPAFGLVVADEAHRIAGIVPTREPAERDRRVVLDAARLRAKRRLFATATPRIYSATTRGRFKELEDVEIASMDDEALFGPVAHRLWFREAVDLGILVDYELVAVLVTDAEVAEMVRDRAGTLVDGRVLDAETLATLVAVRRAIADLGLMRSITFHHTIARARDFATALKRLALTSPPPDTQHISGEMPVGDRERALLALQAPDRPTVVTNARCLTEGIDVPGLDAVAFIDPRASQVDIVQAVGRVMRRATGKARGHVLVPVFLGEADLLDPEAAVAGSAFAKVVDVLRALRAHDPDLSADATRIQASLGPRDAVAGGHIAAHVRLLGTITDPARFEKALELRFVQVASEGFEVGLAVLRRFVAREGHARVLAVHREGAFRLGGWVNHQRTTYVQGRLSPDRVASLEAVPGWTWNPLDDDWDEGLLALRQFARRTGGTTVPNAHREGRVLLGRWVIKKRVAWRGGKLDPKRSAALEAIPGWTWEPYAEAWREGLARLTRYATTHGHSRVPQLYVEDGFQLGTWVANHRRRRDEHTPDQISALESLPGWTWDPHGSKWSQGLAALTTYVKREGHARVPHGHMEGEFQLGGWVRSRLSERKEGRLRPERIAVLEALPGWSWERHADRWAAGVVVLQTFAAREGHTAVPLNHVEGGLGLGQWVSNRRAAYKAGRLGHDQIAELEAIPGWTWRPPHQSTWDTGLTALKNFAAREGHLRVPEDHLENGVQLHRWIGSRRSEFRSGKLAAERAAQLETISGWTWHSTRDSWHTGMSALQAFVAREGRAKVPARSREEGFALGSWVDQRRAEHRRHEMSPDREAALAALPGWSWSPFDDGWNSGMAALLAYVSREGHAHVPGGHVEDGFRLGAWVRNRRYDGRQGTLSRSRVAELEAVPGWSWGRGRATSQAG